MGVDSSMRGSERRVDLLSAVVFVVSDIAVILPEAMDLSPFLQRLEPALRLPAMLKLPMVPSERAGEEDADRCSMTPTSMRGCHGDTAAHIILPYYVVPELLVRIVTEKIAMDEVTTVLYYM